ncbi:hypothetical protein [Borrelia turicatae]|uniref:hypothetical protein n=1 Tax=Borrelia turicatae TaxID=142 RepID=UPI00059B3157|nr:hypothetical protein [Borrelia turicatae]UPA13397.1 hypothetical protein bt91E135_000561 [Borrelia turicatae 91E135]
MICERFVKYCSNVNNLYNFSLVLSYEMKFVIDDFQYTYYLNRVWFWDNISFLGVGSFDVFEHMLKFYFDILLNLSREILKYFS